LAGSLEHLGVGAVDSDLLHGPSRVVKKTADDARQYVQRKTSISIDERDRGKRTRGFCLEVLENG
jgi:hypothetical protein